VEDLIPAPALPSVIAAPLSSCRDEPSRGDSAAGGAAGTPDGSGSTVAKEEGVKAPEAYPIQVS